MAISSYYAMRPENITYYERLDMRFRRASREILPPRLAEETRGRCPSHARSEDAPSPRALIGQRPWRDSLTIRESRTS